MSLPRLPPEPLDPTAQHELIQRGLRAAAAFYGRLQEEGALQALAGAIARSASERLGLPLSATGVERAALRGPGLAALAAFSGEWRGDWGALPVWHRWEPPIDAPPGLRAPPWTVARLQTAWVGDGHGYNLEVVHDARPDAAALLGAVFHLHAPPSDAVAYLTPHLGIGLAPGRVVWLTPAHLFIESIEGAGAAAAYRICQLAWTREAAGARLTPLYETTYRRPGPLAG